jgi:alcohol dehydrogenase class IV
MPDDSIQPIVPEELTLPETTLLGEGRATAVATVGARFGPRGMLVHGRSLRAQGWVARVLAAVPPHIALIPWEHPGGEPTLDQLSALLSAARHAKVDWIVGLGGGSVLDLAKSCAGLWGASRSPVEYHDGAPLEGSMLPFIAAPSTAGSGAEVTVNAVLTNSATGQKKSIRAARLMARIVILDPSLLAACPPQIVAHSGMDAVAQAIEAYCSRYASWFSDSLALEALRLTTANLPAVYANPAGGAARYLMLGSYLAGLALSMARLGVVHGLAHPLGVLYHAPHGQVCAVCLPFALELNRPVIGHKYARMSQAVGGDLLTCVRKLLAHVAIVSPFRGQTLRDEARIVAETLASGSTRANPKPVEAADIQWLLHQLFA